MIRVQGRYRVIQGIDKAYRIQKYSWWMWREIEPFTFFSCKHDAEFQMAVMRLRDRNE